MEYKKYTFVDATSASEISASLAAGGTWVNAQTFAAVTGWSLKPEGFCRGAVCVAAATAVAADGAVDLAAFATLTNRSLVVDAAERAVSMGAACADRAQDLDSLEAPDFSLPDLSGEVHRLSDYRGKKVLLAAYASW